MTDLAVHELQAGSSTGPSWEMLEIAKIYTSGGEYFRALQALKRAISGYFSMDVGELPSPYWQGLFPRPYWDALRSYSEAERTGSVPGRVADPAGIGIQSQRHLARQRLRPDAAVAAHRQRRSQEDRADALQHRLAA